MTSATPRLRMDRARYYSTVHGERVPDDRHAGVHFYQDGLPFDAQGFFVPDILDDKNDPGGKARALYERRLKKLAGKGAAPADADAGADDGSDPADAAADADDPATVLKDDDDINLEAWLRGEAQYQFFVVKAAVRKRFHQNLSDQRSIVQHLVEEEKVIPIGQLSAHNRKLLESFGQAA